MKNEAEGTLGTLMKIAKDWRNRKNSDDPRQKSSLKTLLLTSLIQEVLNQAQEEVATEENKAKVTQAGWLSQESGWIYRVWNHSEKRLCQDTQKETLSHTEAARILTHLQQQINGEIGQRLASTVAFQELEEQGSNVATFQLEISLRGSAAQEVYDHLSRLAGCSILCPGSVNEEGQAPSESVLRALTKDPASLPQASPTGPPLSPAVPGPQVIGNPPVDRDTLPPALPCSRFKGGSNSCYINSFLYSLWTVLRLSGQQRLLPEVFWKESEQPREAMCLVGFKLLGWPEPRRQHDVGELIDHPHVRSLGGAWPP